MLLNGIKLRLKCFKVFQSDEATLLRECLGVMMAMHLLYIVVFPTSIYVMLVDTFLLLLAFKCAEQLYKPFILCYAFSLCIFFFVGITHAKFFTSKIGMGKLTYAEKKEGMLNVFLFIQCVFYLFSSSLVFTKFKNFVIFQEATRVTNMNQEIADKGRVKIRLRNSLNHKL